MLKSVRIWSVLATVVAVALALSQVAVFSVSASQASAVASGNREGGTPKKSKKRKKRKTPNSSATFLVTAPSATQPSTKTTAPVTVDLNGVSEVSVPVTQTTRSSSRAARIPGTRISPIGISGVGGIPPSAGQILISEFRLRGAFAANELTDEFIELYNNSGTAITVSALSGTGLGVAASDGVTRCTIPNSTVIPAAGHYLCVNSVGYSLGAYPAGNSTTATGDATYTTDIPDNAGIAIFNNNTGGASYSLANRLDAVGSTSEANTLYKEGTGYPPLSTGFGVNSSFYRDTCGKGGSITTLGVCTISTPKDTDANAADFIFIDTNGTSLGAGQRLGGPGPENLSSPILRNATIPATLLDPCVAGAIAPNRVRDFTPVTNGSQGTLDIRRTFTNNTGGNVTRLRYRIIDITTFPAPAGVAFLNALTSTDVAVTVDRAPCGSGTSNVTVTGTTLEEAAPPNNQFNGGGFNSSLSSGTVTLGTPLANGASIDIRWVFGIRQTGLFKMFVNIEALP